MLRLVVIFSFLSVLNARFFDFPNLAEISHLGGQSSAPDGCGSFSIRDAFGICIAIGESSGPCSDGKIARRNTTDNSIFCLQRHCDPGFVFNVIDQFCHDVNEAEAFCNGDFRGYETADGHVVCDCPSGFIGAQMKEGLRCMIPFTRAHCAEGQVFVPPGPNRKAPSCEPEGEHSFKSGEIVNQMQFNDNSILFSRDKCPAPIMADSPDSDAAARGSILIDNQRFVLGEQGPCPKNEVLGFDFRVLKPACGPIEFAGLTCPNEGITAPSPPAGAGSLPSGGAGSLPSNTGSPSSGSQPSGSKPSEEIPVTQRPTTSTTKRPTTTTQRPSTSTTSFPNYPDYGEATTFNPGNYGNYEYESSNYESSNYESVDTYYPPGYEWLWGDHRAFRRRREALNAGIVAETNSLLPCRQGAERDINYKCRRFSVAKRETRAGDSGPARAPHRVPRSVNIKCPVGQFVDNMGQCVSREKAQPECPGGMMRDSNGKCVETTKNIG